MLSKSLSGEEISSFAAETINEIHEIVAYTRILLPDMEINVDTLIFQLQTVVNLKNELYTKNQLQVPPSLTLKNETLNIRSEPNLSEKIMTFQQKIADIKTAFRKEIELSIQESLLTLEKRCNSLDLCFCIDITGSMDPYIKMVREKITEIAALLKRPECAFRVAFVGYRDIEDIEKFQVLNFTAELENFDKLLKNISPSGGKDKPEDINGAFQEVSNLNWGNNTNLLIHIADEPCHGNRFHDYSVEEDNYFSGAPTDRPWNIIFEKFIQANINYMFVQIKNSTEKMITEFKALWEECQNEQKSLIFKKFNFDGNPISFVKSTCHTAQTCCSSQMTHHLSQWNSIKQMELKQFNIQNNDSDEEAFISKIPLSRKVEAILPLWDSKDFFDLELNCKITYIFKSGEDAFGFKRDKAQIKIRSTPFATGTFQNAYFSVIQPSNYKYPFHMVLKQFKVNQGNPFDSKEYKVALIKNNIASNLAKRFNHALDKIKQDPKYRIYFQRIQYTRVGQNPCLLEPFMKGQYVKYSNNRTYVNESVPIMTAFSHFSYIHSGGEFMVTDLQGVNNLLADPVVHSKNIEFCNHGDFGIVGMIEFFRNHECNDLCRKLALPSHAAQQNRTSSIIYDDISFSLDNLYQKCANFYCNSHSQNAGEYCEFCKENLLQLNQYLQFIKQSLTFSQIQKVTIFVGKDLKMQGIIPLNRPPIPSC